MITTVLYALCDSGGEIRYIGKTTRMSLESRLRRHIMDARRGFRNHRCNWIRSLIADGLTPTIKEIQRVPGDGCKEEIELIRKMRLEGKRLVNGTDGGQGSLGRIVPQTTIDAVVRAHKGVPLTVEHRAKISAAFKGRPISEELRRKISIARINSPAARAHALAQRGLIMSPEHRANLTAGIRRYFATKKLEKLKMLAGYDRNLILPLSP